MDVAHGTHRGRALPAGVLGMLALIAAAETFISRHDLDAVAPGDWQYLLARRDGARQAQGRDVLVLGDSQAKFGILPKVLGARGGLRAYNLAIWGGQAPTSYELLRRALDAGARPSAVIVDFNPLLLAKPPRASREQLPFLLGLGATLRLAWESRDPALLAELTSRRLLPCVRCRTTLRAWIRSTVEGRAHRYRLLMPEALRHWATHDGALVVPAQPGRAFDIAAHRRLAYRGGWIPHRVNADYVRRFLRLAEAHRVTVYWLIPPAQAALEAANAQSGFDARYLAFVRRQQRDFPGLFVLDGRHTGYDPAVFLDLDHLGREGAFALSQDLGDLLRRLRRGPSPGRWIPLPVYQPRPTDPAILAARMDVFLPETTPGVTRR